MPSWFSHAPRAACRCAGCTPRSCGSATCVAPETDIRTRAELLDSLGEQLDFSDRWEDYAETRTEAAALWHELATSHASLIRY